MKKTARRFNVKQYSNEEFAKTAGKMKTWLASLARRRSTGIVTADDVHTYLDRQGVRPQQIKTRLSFINAVLREPTFESAGRTASARSAAKYRRINAWTLA